MESQGTFPETFEQQVVASQWRTVRHLDSGVVLVSSHEPSYLRPPQKKKPIKLIHYYDNSNVYTSTKKFFELILRKTYEQDKTLMDRPKNKPKQKKKITVSLDRYT